MKLIFKEDKEIDFEQILFLYNDVGWTAYTQDPATLKKAISNSLQVISAWENNTLLGLIRVVGDGETIIYIQDILVLKKYQRKGIGRKLMNRILDAYTHVRQKILLTDDTLQTRQFYTSLGFSSCDDGRLIAFIRK